MTEDTFTPGEPVFYANYDDRHYPVKVSATVVREVEGWVEVQFRDDSRCVVRPSRLMRRGQ